MSWWKSPKFNEIGDMLKHVHGYFYEPFGGNQTIGIFDMRYTEI